MRRVVGDERGRDLMKPRLRTVFRLLALIAGVALIVVGRMALYDGAWRAPLARDLASVGELVGGAFTGITQPGNALPFFLAALGCLVVGFVLPSPSGGPAWPAIEPRRVQLRGARATLLLAVLALAITAYSVDLLRRDNPTNIAALVWFVTLPLGGAAALLLDRRRGTPIGNPLPARIDLIAALALFGGCMVLVGHDIGHWRWMGTPDEANFFPFAREMARGESHHFLLREGGMYDVHPILSSYYQAAFMYVFGVGIFGWRLSSVFALAASLPFVYLVARELWSRRAGVAAGVFFGSTPLAVGFAHFGYNNAQIYLPVTGSLAALVWAMRRRSVFGYWLAGTIAGLSVFTFYPARVSAPLLVLLAFGVGELPWRTTPAGARRVPVLEWSALVLAALIAATPCLVHPQDTFDRMTGQTAFSPPRGKAAEGETPPSLLERVADKSGRVLRHLNVSALFPLWYPNPSHFQTNSVIDPLQGALAIVGLVLALRGFRRDAGSRFVLLAYLFSALVVGSVSQHDSPPLTRLLFLCPFIGLLAALAVRQVGVGLGIEGTRRRFAAIVASLLVATSALWGFGLLRYGIYVRDHGYGEGTTSELVRVMRALPPDWRVIYVQRIPTYMASVDASLAMYDLHERFTYLRQSTEILRHLPKPGETSFLLVDDLPPVPARDDLERAMSERFPGRDWRETAPGRRWNLRVLPVAAEGDGGWEPPSTGERGDIGQMLLGFLDW